MKYKWQVLQYLLVHASVAEETGVLRMYHFRLKKLAPIFPLYTAKNDKQARELCFSLLNLGGEEVTAYRSAQTMML